MRVLLALAFLMLISMCSEVAFKTADGAGIEEKIFDTNVLVSEDIKESSVGASSSDEGGWSSSDEGNQGRCVNHGYFEDTDRAEHQTHNWACCANCPSMHGVSMYDTCDRGCACICRPMPYRCASEHHTCHCSGTVSYGHGSTWIYKNANPSIPCTNEAFGHDPVFGTVKECHCVAGVSIEESLGQGIESLKYYKRSNLTDSQTAELALAQTSPQEIIVETCWGYPYDAQQWGAIVDDSLCATGTQQSPIELPLIDSAISQKNLAVNWKAAGYKLVDNGHGLEWNPSVDAGNLVLGKTTYDLIQLKLHTKSEHTFKGKQYPLEMHFIHSDIEGNIAVLALLCEQQLRREKSKESQFFQSLKSCEKESQTIDFSDILKTVTTKKYFQYPGSLTTPGCDEAVFWTVIADTCDVPRNFLKWTKRYESMKQNYRPTQPLNGRDISGSIFSEVNLASCESTETHKTTAFIMITHALTLLFGIGIGFASQFQTVLHYLYKKDPEFEPLLHA